MQDSAGRAYGFDAVTAWPRLYPVLGDQCRTLVDDRRDTLHASVRLAATMAVTALASLVLLLGAGWSIVLALIPLSVAALAYNAAVQAALAFAETVHVAFDLHRADLLTALRMDLPGQREAERILNEQWCDHWRQGIPLPPLATMAPAETVLTNCPVPSNLESSTLDFAGVVHIEGTVCQTGTSRRSESHGASACSSAIAPAAVDRMVRAGSRHGRARAARTRGDGRAVANRAAGRRGRGSSGCVGSCPRRSLGDDAA